MWFIQRLSCLYVWITKSIRSVNVSVSIVIVYSTKFTYSTCFFFFDSLLQMYTHYNFASSWISKQLSCDVIHHTWHLDLFCGYNLWCYKKGSLPFGILFLVICSGARSIMNTSIVISISQNLNFKLPVYLCRIKTFTTTRINGW